ncbi:MAG TPA: hypothetical protein VGT99_09410 [Gammaproteobacteria bacterium]|nr:hypothetical protein [Gammaproteobacteria bacterium]
MNKSVRDALLALSATLLSTGASAADLTPSAVLYGANQYNGQEISVTGVVSQFKLNTGNDGKPYESFKLCDAGACLTVYALGSDTRTEGKEITVSGHFWMFVQRGYLTFHNELDLD